MYEIVIHNRYATYNLDRLITDIFYNSLFYRYLSFYPYKSKEYCHANLKIINAYSKQADGADFVYRIYYICG